MVGLTDFLERTFGWVEAQSWGFVGLLGLVLAGVAMYVAARVVKKGFSEDDTKGGKHVGKAWA
jgi:hypothetical protein